MLWVIAYVGVGAFLAYGLREANDRPVLYDPILALFVILLWPAILIYLLPRVSVLKYKGKVLWERKK